MEDVRDFNSNNLLSRHNILLSFSPNPVLEKSLSSACSSSKGNMIVRVLPHSAVFKTTSYSSTYQLISIPADKVLVLKEIQRELAILKPPTLDTAVGLAKLIEDKIKAELMANAKTPAIFSQNRSSTHSTTPIFPTPPNFPQQPIKRPTQNELQERKKKAGLKAEVQRELAILKPPTLDTEVGLAKLIEDKIKAERMANAKTPATFSQNQSSTHSTTPIFPTPPNFPQQPIKRLTQNELQERQKKGLCFNCDELYRVGHKCRSPHILLLIPDEVDPTLLSMENLETEHPPPLPLSLLTRSPSRPVAIPSTEGTIPQDFSNDKSSEPVLFHISYVAYSGSGNMKTLRITGSLNGLQVTVLIDSGSTHNVIQPRIAEFLGLPVLATPAFPVMVGNGAKIECSGRSLGNVEKFGVSDIVVGEHVMEIREERERIKVHSTAATSERSEHLPEHSILAPLPTITGNAGVASTGNPRNSAIRGKENTVANALSRIDSSHTPTFCAFTTPTLPWLGQLRKYFTDHQKGQGFVKKVGTGGLKDYNIHSDLVFFRDRLYIPDVPGLRNQLIQEAHSTPMGGHSATSGKRSFEFKALPLTTVAHTTHKVTSEKMGEFGEPVDNDPNRYFTIRCGKGCDKIHADVLPNTGWDRKCSEQTVRFLGTVFVLLTYLAHFNKCLDRFTPGTSGKENTVADALSRIDSSHTPTFCAFTTPTLPWLGQLRKYFTDHQEGQEFVKKVRTGGLKDYNIHSDLVFFRDRLYIPDVPGLRNQLIQEAHSTPMGGHSDMSTTQIQYPKTVRSADCTFDPSPCLGGHQHGFYHTPSRILW
nr:hypothetical protein [Tanacetum cinerariifolium]